MIDAGFRQDVEKVLQLIEWWKDMKYRPTGILHFYEQHVERIRHRENPSVLVLGATPELRMLALRKGCRVTAVDRSLTVINAMSEFMDYEGLDRTRETVVNGNWLTAPLERGGYDLAVGDGLMNEMDRLEDYYVLLERIKGLLKPDGYLSLRSASLPDNWKPFKMLDILEDYRTTSDGKNPSGSFSLETMFRLMLSVESYDEKTSRFSWKEMIAALKKFDEEGKMREEIFRPILDYFRAMPPVWTAWDRTIPRKNVLENYLTGHFTIVRDGIVKESPPNLYLLKPR